LATIAAGGQPKYLEGFGPKVDGFDQVAFADLDAVKSTISDETAGILIEPIQGEGGIRPVPNEQLRILRDLCDEHDILLVLDEIQSGMGRTGKLFAHEWAGITPDIMAIAKAIGGGFPLGACLATEAAAAGMTAGTHGTTFGGNPLAMAVGNAVMDIIADEEFLANVRILGLLLKQKLAAVADAHPDLVEEIRGEGLMIGVRCKKSNADLVAAAIEEELLVVQAGDNVVRFLPPLIVSQEEVDEAVDRLDRALTRLSSRSAA
jgi:acetylornithine/N-succinyldiaminopimelate aminotransferase